MIKNADYGNYRNTLPTSWTAADRHGNQITDSSHKPDGKVVGLFYWTWHGNKIENPTVGNGPYDVTKILNQYPNALDEPDNPSWGKMGGGTHYWSEPMFGYYLNDDEYVIRKHAQMMCDAGIDFIAFDSSNFHVKKDSRGEHPGYFRISTKFLFETYMKIRSEGKPTPQCTFIMPFFTPDFTCIRTVYEDFYKSGEYDDLWYRIDDKPVMLFAPENVHDDELLEYFTFRRSMPDYHMGPTGENQWPWLENYPQHPFFASYDKNRPEMVGVGVAQNSVINPDGGWRLGSLSERDENGRFIGRGRSFRNGEQPQPNTAGYLPEKGFNFLEQWKRAFELDPHAVFITGWNEWIMGRWQTFSHYYNAAGCFVDQFNQEFSRDIEPMKGGHLDDYYYLLVDNIRKFKGLPERENTLQIHTPDMDDFTSWEKVGSCYFDDVGDNIGRNHRGFGEAGLYVVPEGRNDFVTSKVCHDDSNIYFYMQTNEDIKPYICAARGSWMQLLIRIHDENGNPADMPNWEGFHFTVNRSLKNSCTSVLEFSKGGWEWTAVCEVDLRVKGKALALRIPKKSILQDCGNVSFDFKWIDSNSPEEDILQLYTHGDTAPNARFMYRYSK